MLDREKVIKGLELCKQDAKLCFSETECPYQCEFQRCCLKLMTDALALIDTQYKLILELQNLISIGTKIMNGDEA